MRKYRPRVRALKLAKQVRDRLTKELGRSVRVIMFGSQARGDAKKDSDIDLLVSATMYLAFDVAWEVGFEAGKVISVVPAEKNEWKRLAASPFYRAVKREGIAI
jgi:predicted nucleotidyltransferase